MKNKVLQPAGWPRPKGYANGLVARGRVIVLAGQIGWDANERFNSGRLADQVGQALRNIVTLLHEAGAEAQHLVRLTWFVTDLEEYRREIAAVGAAYREVLGKTFPAMSVVQVAGLVEAQAKVEIEATAILPDD
ncbi:MAG: RidA family protein [Steroidobacteraceae bacterium]